MAITQFSQWSTTAASNTDLNSIPLDGASMLANQVDDAFREMMKQLASAGFINTGNLGTGVATFLATPSSANLRAALTDETGTGAAVFGTSPVFTTSIGIGTTPAVGASLHMDASGSNYIRFSESGTLRGLVGITPGGGSLLSGDSDNELIIRGDAGIKFGVGTEALSIPGVGQLKFPATQNASSDANTLDDYEELNEASISQGAGISSGSGTITTASGDRSYTKVGRLVTVTYNYTITTIGTAGTSIILTLPFTASASGGPWVGPVAQTSSAGSMMYASIAEGASTAVIAYVPFVANGTYVLTISYWSAT